MELIKISIVKSELSGIFKLSGRRKLSLRKQRFLIIIHVTKRNKFLRKNNLFGENSDSDWFRCGLAWCLTSKSPKNISFEEINLKNLTFVSIGGKTGFAFMSYLQSGGFLIYFTCLFFFRIHGSTMLCKDVRWMCSWTVSFGASRQIMRMRRWLEQPSPRPWF